MASAADRLNISSQLEHLQSRHVGTGHADATRHEWAVNIHRDSYASYVGHHAMASYFAVANGESVGRTKYELTQKMLLPCGLPPELEEEQGGCGRTRIASGGDISLRGARCIVIEMFGLGAV